MVDPETLMRRARNVYDLGHLADEMEYLWENPDEYEKGQIASERLDQHGDASAGELFLAAHIDNYEPQQEKHEVAAFLLGVVFGTEYEQAYPEDPDADWREEYDHETPNAVEDKYA